MNFKLILVCLLALSFNCVRAQWDVVFSNTQSIKDIHFVDAQSGFAISSTRLIFTADSGKTWNFTEYTEGSFTEMEFPSHDTGYVSGTALEGPLFTHNSGETWEYKSTAPFYDFNGTSISMINNDTGYVGTTAPSLRMTMNGWDFETGSGIPGGEDIKSIHFFDVDTGYVSTAHFVLKTTNSGETWEYLPTSAGWIYKFIFLSPDFGYAIDPYKLYKITDYGDQWDTIALPLSGNRTIAAFAMIGADTMYIGGENNNKPFICRSFDGGLHWVFTEIDDEADYDPVAITGFYCFDGYNCFATTSYTGYILHTNNGGDTPLPVSNIDRCYFSIYPNPSAFEISIAAESNSEIQEIVTSNCMGEQIDVQWDDDLTADIHWLPRGVYFSKIVTSNGNRILKWMKY